ncbi:uncharacterized protein METZ01_LOCUS489775, partial [marine metagenome]
MLEQDLWEVEVAVSLSHQFQAQIYVVERDGQVLFIETIYREELFPFDGHAGSRDSGNIMGEIGSVHLFRVIGRKLPE